jgi:hypothetical protein
MMAVLWGGTKPGMVDFRRRHTQGQDDGNPTMLGGDDFFFGDAAQFLVQSLGLFRRPGMVFFSGFMTTMKKPHSRRS